VAVDDRVDRVAQSGSSQPAAAEEGIDLHRLALDRAAIGE
jgi:hypothetical protein